MPSAKQDPQHAQLSGVEEVRTAVTHDLNLFLSLALHPVVALALLAQPVLTLEHEMHEDCSTEEEEELVGQNDTVAGPVAWLLLLGVDVG